MGKSSSSGNPLTNLENAINDFLSSGSLKAAVFRANDIFSFGTKVLAALAFTCFLSTTFLHNTTVPHISTRWESGERFDLTDVSLFLSSKVYLVRGQGSGLTGDRDYYDNSGNDQAFINFDLKADLSPLFNWNVKVNTSMTRREVTESYWYYRRCISTWQQNISPRPMSSMRWFSGTRSLWTERRWN